MWGVGGEGRMAKVVSETLFVRLSSKKGEVIHDFMKLFNENPNRIISVVGTVNEEGTPNTAPMSLFFCPDEKTIIAGMVKTSKTVENIRRGSPLIMEVLFDGDIAFGIAGRGEIIKEPLDCSDATLAVKIDVEGVKRDTSPAQVITAGVSITPRSERGTAYEKAAWAELIEIGNSL